MSKPSDISELRAQAATPQAQDPKQRVRRTWLIKSLLDLITTNPDELVDKASVLLSAVLVSKQRTVSTNPTTPSQLFCSFTDRRYSYAQLTRPLRKSSAFSIWSRSRHP